MISDEVIQEWKKMLPPDPNSHFYSEYWYLQAVRDLLAEIQRLSDRDDCRKRLAETQEYADRLEKVVEIQRNYLNRLPFCSDHRDKVQGKSCRDCHIEQLMKFVEDVSKGLSNNGEFPIARWISKAKRILKGE